MGHAYQSPLKRHDVLAGLCKQAGAKLFVEVGCKEGRTTAHLLNDLPDLRVVAIDPWAPVPNADEDYKGWDFDQIERDFWINVGDNQHRVHMLRMTSVEAADRFNIESDETRAILYTSPNGLNAAESVSLPPIDVAFIDAGHDFENALQDIRAWWPLVRDGGYLCGHDYQHKFPGVMRAVARAFPLLRVAVCPDSVWVVQKSEDVRCAA